MDPINSCSNCLGLVPKTVNLLVEKGADLYSEDLVKRTPMHFALEVDDHCAIRALVEAGFDLNIDFDRGSPSILHCAILGAARLDTISLLLQLGADPTKSDGYGRTSVHIAATKNAIDVLELLASKGADIFTKDIGGSTALHQAAWHGHESIVNWFLDKGFSPNVTDETGWTPLHYAAEWNRLDIAQLLLNRSADVNSPDEHSYTPLYWANYCGHKAMSKLLASWGGVARNIPTRIRTDSVDA